MKSVYFVTMALSCLMASGSLAVNSLSLVGTGEDSAKWSLDPNNKVWKIVGSEIEAAFCEGDDATIGSDFTGQNVVMGELVNPGAVVFDIPQGKVVSWGGDTTATARATGFGPQTKSFVKRGAGTLKAVGFSELKLSNTYGGGVDIEEGEIAIMNPNAHNSLGIALMSTATKPADGYWVNVSPDAKLTLNQRNQTSTSCDSSDGLFNVFLDAGATLSLYPETTTTGNNHCNVFRWLKFDARAIFLSTPYGRIKNVNVAQNTTDAFGYSGLRVSKGLHFAGTQVHRFGPSSLGVGGNSWRMSLRHDSPVEFKVDNITGDDRVDAYVDLSTFTWRNGTTACLSKTGEGTLALTNAWGKTNYGDITVESGTLIFATGQAFLPSTRGTKEQKLIVKKGATLDIQKRNIVEGSGNNIPNNSIEVDQGTLNMDFSRPEVEEGASGWIRFAKWTFKDAEFYFANRGQGGGCTPALVAFDEFNVLGTKPITIEKSYTAKVGWLGNQTLAVYTNTIFTIEDVTQDAAADLTLGLDVVPYTKNGTTFVADCGFTKRGAGTMRLMAANNKVDGLVKVEAGQLRVDGTLTTPSSIVVAEGGFLGGTGTVAKVTFETGAGVAMNEVDASASAPLRVSGSLALPSSGVVVVPALKEEIAGPLCGRPILEVSGDISADDLSDWKIVDRAGAEVVSSNAVYVRGGKVYAGERRGLLMLLK